MPAGTFIRTKELRNRISKSLKGRHVSSNTEFKKGQNCGFTHPNWKGGRIISGGFIKILVRNHPNKQRYTAEHRLIVEKQLGRYLKSTEPVHHINGNKQDNRLENLYLFYNCAYHIHFHRKVNNGKLKLSSLKSNLITKLQ